MSEISEAETCLQFKEALRVYSQNTMNDSNLGIFKGIREGVTVKMQLQGSRLRIVPSEVVDVSDYEDKIKALEETVKEQKKEISRLKKKEEY